MKAKLTRNNLLHGKVFTKTEKDDPQKCIFIKLRNLSIINSNYEKV